MAFTVGVETYKFPAYSDALVKALRNTGVFVRVDHLERFSSPPALVARVEREIYGSRPMITREEYERIQVIKKGKSSNATRRRLSVNPDFPLRRFVRCGCGHPYTASWSAGRSKKYPFYLCHNKECLDFGHTVSKDTLENKFCQLLQGVSPSPQFLEYFKQTVIDCYRERCTAEKQEKEYYERERAKLENRRKELLDMRIGGEISKEEYKDLKGIVDGQIARLTTSHDETGTIDLETTVSYSIELLGDLAGKWRVMPIQRKQQLQKVVLPGGITYQKADGVFGTAILSPVFRLNSQFRNDLSGLVAEVGRNWNQIILDVRKLHALAQDDVALFDEVEKAANFSLNCHSSALSSNSHN